MSYSPVYSQAYSVSKSARFKYTTNDTPGHVYEVSSPISKDSRNVWTAKKGHAPLYDNLETPGPGSYHNESPKRIPGASYKWNTKRFDDSPYSKVETATPGPGEYDSPTKSSGKMWTMAPKIAPVTDRIDLGPGSYSPKRLFDDNYPRNGSPLSRTKRPPPTTRDVNEPGPGRYELNSTLKGKLTKFNPRDRDHYLDAVQREAAMSPGPGHFGGHHVRSMSNLSMNSRLWSGKQGHLSLVDERNDSPGPGTYHRDAGILRDISPTRGKFSYVSKEVVDREALARPGPGTYSPSRELRPQTCGSPLSRQIGRPEHRPSEAPGPGFYETPSKAVNAVPSYSFGERREDLIMKAKREIPGPGEYQPCTRGSLKSKLITEYMSRGHRADQWLYPGDVNPGPGNYSMYEQGSPMGKFSKLTKDFSYANDIPGPGFYEPMRIFGNVPSYVSLDRSKTNY